MHLDGSPLLYHMHFITEPPMLVGYMLAAYGPMAGATCVIMALFLVSPIHFF